MKERSNRNAELIDFEVQIPNLEGDGIAEVHSIKVMARRAGNEWILTNEALDQIEQTQARYMGLMSPQEIKELRTRIQFTQREMSELIQAGEKSYTRWETGRVRLSRLVNIVLCAIRDGFLPLPYLQTLSKQGSDWHRKVVEYELSGEPAAAKVAPAVSPSPFTCAGTGAAWRDSRSGLVPLMNFSPNLV